MNFNKYRTHVLCAMILCITMLVVSTVFATGTQENNQERDKNSIYVSIPPLKYFVDTISGNTMNVVSLVPDGRNAELYDPTSNQLFRLQEKSHAFFAIGLPYEEKVLHMLEESNYKNVVVVGSEITRIVDDEEHDDEEYDDEEHDDEEYDDEEHDDEEHDDEEHDDEEHDDEEHDDEEHDDEEHDDEEHDDEEHDDEEHDDEEHDDEEYDDEEHDDEEYDDEEHDDEEHDHADGDPHIWMSILNASTIAEDIYNALVRMYPDKREILDEGYARLLDEIKEVQDLAYELLSPYEGYAFLIYHPALTYFAEDTGLIQLSIQWKGQERSLKQIRETLEYAQNNKVNIVFIQEGFSKTASETIAKQIDAKLVKLSPLQENWKSNMFEIIKTLEKSFRSL